MTDTTGSTETVLRERIAAALAVAEPGPGEDHPDAEQLIAYRGDELSEGEARSVQEHLLVCRRCLQDFLDLERFVRTADEPAVRAAEEVGVSSFEAASAWRALRSSSSLFRLPSRAPWLSRAPVTAVAASLLVAVVGLGSWGFHEHNTAEAHRRQLAVLRHPQPNVRIVDLLPDSSLRGGAEETATGGPGPTIAEIDPGTYLTLVLTLPGAAPPRAYETVIVDARGQEKWRGELLADEHGTLSLGLPATFLDPGEYSVLLYAGDEPIEVFPLRLVAAGEVP